MWLTNTDWMNTYYGRGDGLDRENYERDLRERQHRHLDSIREHEFRPPWSPCMHDGCQRCHGTGVSINGSCVHMMSCPCPKCTPYC